MDDKEFFLGQLRYATADGTIDGYLTDAAERLVNNFGFDARSMAQTILSDEWLLIERFWAIAYEWIRFYGRELPPDRHDDRNALAIAKNFVKRSQTMHRTLMQTFTKLIFAFIDCSWGAIKDEIVICFHNDPDWWVLPLI